MDYTILIVNSEEEYLDLIADAIDYGRHCPNQYAHKIDTRGMSLSDSFQRLSIEDVNEYTGFCNSDLDPGESREYIDEEGKVWDEEEHPVRVTRETYLQKNYKVIRKNMRLTTGKYDSNLLLPTKEDYPILLIWNWEDSFDRCGDITTRVFLWLPLNKVERSHIMGRSKFKRDAVAWRRRYMKQYQEFVKRQQEQLERDRKKIQEEQLAKESSLGE